MCRNLPVALGNRGGLLMFIPPAGQAVTEERSFFGVYATLMLPFTPNKFMLGLELGVLGLLMHDM